MAAFKEYADYDALGLGELIARRQVKAEEVLEAAIERIESLNSSINAVVHKMYDPVTPQFNASGGPAASLPLHWTPDGLPVGIQLGANFGNEALLFRIAAQLEDARPWRSRRPPIWRAGATART